MTSFSVDTSALIKRYVRETGSGWIRTLIAPRSGNRISISDFTPIEVFATFARLQRDRIISPNEADMLRAGFYKHYLKEYAPVEIKDSVLTNAREFVTKYPLRPPDALQLASALYIARDLGEDAVFLCADHQLLAAAEAERLATDNPNLHP